MKRIGLVILCFGASVLLLGIGLTLSVHSIRQRHTHSVCLVSHHAVILIPTVCGEHEVCARPIVAELCDSVEMPAK